MKSLQDKYNLIKEGKGNEELFLKEARTMFPNVVTNVLTFDQAVHNLSERGIISEALVFGGIAQPKTPDWFKVFNENTKVDKEVEAMETKGYDYKDDKEGNNQSMGEILTGFYAEMQNPKNNGKTAEELKAIVIKNLAKDPLYYVKDGQFGLEGVGYTDEAPGLGATKEVTGKYKSSGMEPVKLNEGMYTDSDGDYEHDMETEIRANEYYDKGLEAYIEGDMLAAEKYYKAALKAGSWLGWTEEDLPFYSELQNGSLEEANIFDSPYWKKKLKDLMDKGMSEKEAKAKITSDINAADREAERAEKRAFRETLNEAKNKAMEKIMKEIDKKGDLAGVEAKMNEIDTLIAELESKLTMTEADEMADMVDKKRVKEIKKDIKYLQKRKSLYEKMHSKMASKMDKKHDKVVDEELLDEGKEEDQMLSSMKRDVDNKVKTWPEIIKDLLAQKGVKK